MFSVQFTGPVKLCTIIAQWRLLMFKVQFKDPAFSEWKMFQMSEFSRYLQYISQEELSNGCSPDTKWKPTEDFEPWPQRLVYEGTDVIQRYPKSRVVVSSTLATGICPRTLAWATVWHAATWNNLEVLITFVLTCLDRLSWCGRANKARETRGLEFCKGFRSITVNLCKLSCLMGLMDPYGATVSVCTWVCTWARWAHEHDEHPCRNMSKLKSQHLGGLGCVVQQCSEATCSSTKYKLRRSSALSQRDASCCLMQCIWARYALCHYASLCITMQRFRLGCVAGKALDYLVQQRKNVATSSFALTSRGFAVPWPSKQFCWVLYNTYNIL